MEVYDGSHQTIDNIPTALCRRKSLMFGRLPRRGDTLSGACVEDIRAAGFDVLFAPTPHNPFHVRIVAKTHTFDAAGREALALAFDRIVRQRY
jgi:hypothetical protein